MMRLLVRCEEPKWYSAAMPVRGATVLFHGADVNQVPLAEFDAVAFVRSGPFAADEAQQLVHAGKRVLVVADACRSLHILSSSISAQRIQKDPAKQIAVLNPVQFLPSRKFIRQRLASGKLGLPGLVRIHSWRCDHENTEEIVGVPLLCDLEFTISLFGEKPQLVYAVQRQGTKPLAQDYVQVHVGFRSGGMALIDFTDRLPAGNDYGSFHVIGSQGAAYADDRQNAQLLFRANHSHAIRTDESMDQWAAMLQDFVDGIRTREGLSANPVFWSDALKTANAVKQALDERRPVVLPE